MLDGEREERLSGSPSIGSASTRRSRRWPAAPAIRGRSARRCRPGRRARAAWRAARRGPRRGRADGRAPWWSARSRRWRPARCAGEAPTAAPIWASGLRLECGSVRSPLRVDGVVGGMSVMVMVLLMGATCRVWITGGRQIGAGIARPRVPSHRRGRRRGGSGQAGSRSGGARRRRSRRGRGQRRLVLVLGEAGIGKTTTARDVAAAARRTGAFVRWSACWSGAARSPTPLVDAARPGSAAGAGRGAKAMAASSARRATPRPPPRAATGLGLRGRRRRARGGDRASGPRCSCSTTSIGPTRDGAAPRRRGRPPPGLPCSWSAPTATPTSRRARR